jgi:hypothetical protein
MKRSVVFTPLSLAAVKQAATELMRAHGTTTTLEVKNRLRSQGYWALQADVSRLMEALADAEGWLYEAGPGFRVYCLPGACTDTAGRVWPAFLCN